MSEMPTWQGFLAPVLRVLSSGETLHARELQPLVAAVAQLSEAQKGEWLASGTRLKYEDRIGWALSFLTNVGALERPKRGFYRIDAAGSELLQRFPEGMTDSQVKALGADPNSLVREYQRGSRVENASAVQPVEGEDSLMTPLEQVQAGVERMNAEVAAQLLERLRESDPAFFEHTVVKLLLAMGYGGATGKGTVTQLSNDGGIDGVIDQDILGLSRVYVQAKRYAEGNTVGRPDLQAFVGAIAGKADSGVFITTSRFSQGAKEYVESVPSRIVLIDADRLTSLMIRFGVGVQLQETYKIVGIDGDFFA